MNAKQKAQREAIEYLKSRIRPGGTVYTVLKHVSKSGMMRVIDVYYMSDNEPMRISFRVSEAIGDTYDRNHEGVKVTGCGMDMGFDVVYRLGYALWPDGFDCIGENCPSNDHHNREQNARHKDGGYALRHRWM